MSRGFEPTTAVFDQAKTVLALDRAATVIGGLCSDGVKKSNDSNMDGATLVYITTGVGTVTESSSFLHYGPRNLHWHEHFRTC
jgi:hypothetical protein